MIDERLIAFLTESLRIEGIYRKPTDAELLATEDFLEMDSIPLDVVCTLQAVYAPKMPLRRRRSMNVRVGAYVAPPGGPEIAVQLDELCAQASLSNNPWQTHIEFEKLHPFLDGNGRVGRAVWAWHMRRCGRDPFSLPFLHRWYYQTLENVDRQPADAETV